MFPRAVETFSAGLPPDLQVPSSLNCRRRSFRSAMLSNRGPLEIVPLDAPLGGWPLRQKALEDAPRNPDHTTVLADLDPELHGLLLGVPAGILGEGKEQGGPAALVGLFRIVL
jgi:hypothetical protein